MSWISHGYFLTVPLITAIHLLKQVIFCFALIVCEFFFFNAEVRQSGQCLIAWGITSQMPTEVYKKLSQSERKMLKTDETLQQILKYH